MKQLIIFPILILFQSLFGQNTWQNASITFLNNKESSSDYLSKGILEDANMEPLVNLLRKEVESENTDPNLQHLLSLFASATYIESDQHDFEAALSAYVDVPVNKALLALEISQLERFEDSFPYQINFNEISKRLKVEDSDWMLRAYLIKYIVQSNADNLSNAESITQLLEVLAMIEENKGTDTQLYRELIDILADKYHGVGEVEKAVKWERRSFDYEYKSVTSQLHWTISDDSKRDLSLDGLSDLQFNTLLIGKLFEKTSDSFFAKRKAIQLYEKLFQSLVPSQNQRQFNLTNTLGILHLEIGNPVKATEYLQIALAKYKLLEVPNIASKGTYLNCQMQLGCSFYESGKYDLALEVFTELYNLNIGNSQKLLVHNLILTSDKMKDGAKVRKYIDIMLNLIGQDVDQANPLILRKYGQISMKSGEFEQAYQLFKQGYDTYWSLAQSAYFDEGMDMVDEELEEYGMSEIREDNTAVSLGTNEAVIVTYEGGARPTDKNYPPLLGDLAISAYLTDHLAEATKFIGDFIDEFYTEVQCRRDRAEIEEYSFGSDLDDIYRLKEILFPKYELFHNIILKNGEVTKEERSEDLQLAYNRILDSKSNIQFELRHMRKNIAESSDSTIQATYQHYLQVREQYSGAQNDIEFQKGLKIELKDILYKLSELSADVKNFDEQFVFWKDIQEELGNDEAAIEIKRVEDVASDSVFYLAYIIRSNSKHPELVVFNNGNLMEGDGLLNYKNSIKFKIEDKVSFGMYWEPLMPYLKGVKTVIISPDGAYHQISLSTLWDPKVEQYVDENINIIQMVSTKQLLETPKTRKEIKRATLIGRPTYDLNEFNLEIETGEMPVSEERTFRRNHILKGEISDLPGTEVEVRNIEKTLRSKKIQTDLFLGNKSLEENLKASQGNLIHIATHGFWFEEDGESNADAMFQSGLLFAGVTNHAKSSSNDPNDGILTAYEIQGMSLEHTQVVVLSACETGLGKIDINEGVYGLQRAFIIAGVDQLIMSLWKVDDDATQQLFSEFYEQWLVEGKSVREAFLGAKKVIRKKYPEPYYWGAFVLIE